MDATSYEVKRSTTSGAEMTVATISRPVINFDVPGGASGCTNYTGQGGGYFDEGHNYWNPFVLNGTTTAAVNSDGMTVSPITLTDNSLLNSNHGISFGVTQGELGTVAGLEAPYAYANNYIMLG